MLKQDQIQDGQKDILGGHIDAIWLADTQQNLFNSLMQTLARPGRLSDWSEWIEQNPVYLAVLATLLDGEVSLADANNLLNATDWPLLQARSAAAEHADYILCDASKPVNFEPKLGTLASPDFAATLILKVGQLSSEQGDVCLTLTGPGVKGQAQAFLSGIDQAWLEQRNEWCSAFPLGVDYILVDDSQIMGLPRTTKLEFEQTNMGGQD
ncbi:phosphonate C-P lyase system protein PhnH [Vibrio sp.]|uniref:phosphonate C-P lyase system protein PhnH n=1 Tax=Vibrio sp. TaxID=678 RepID=UPI003D09D359